MVFPKEKQRRALAKLDAMEIKARRSGPAFQSVKLCNCARCDGELIGDSDASKSHHSTFYAIPIVFGRLRGRPYCQRCYREVEQFQRRQGQPPAA
jgi:hypothetical protein